MERSPEFIEPRKTPEQTANYEGSHTLLFLDRIKNPEIKKRLIDNLWEHGNTADKEYFRKQYGLSKEEIERDLDDKIKKALDHTDIEYSDRPESAGPARHEQNGVIANLEAINPDTGEVYTTHARNVIEAHEKGHQIRHFDDDCNSDFQKRLLSGFDFSNVKFSERTILLNKEYYEKIHNKPIDIGDLELEKKLRYYFSKIDEILERMSQLKNYFGMKNSDVFTKEHLHYAKEHYSEDTQIPGDLQVQPFFDAITPETEEEFIKLMNTLGI